MKSGVVDHWPKIRRLLWVISQGGSLVTLAIAVGVVFNGLGRIASAMIGLPLQVADRWGDHLMEPNWIMMTTVVGIPAGLGLSIWIATRLDWSTKERR